MGRLDKFQRYIVVVHSLNLYPRHKGTIVGVAISLPYLTCTAGKLRLGRTVGTAGRARVC
jgi:hypothetical protein